MPNIKEKKLSKKETIIIIVMMLLFLPFLIFIFISKSKEIDKKIETYPNLYHSYSFSSRLQEITIEKGFKNKGAVYINLSNGNKYSLLFNPRNYEYSPANLTDFIQKGDSIYKRAYNDTIYIYRNAKEYYFVLDQVINKEKK